MLGLENAEEILQILDRFTKLKSKDIPQELEDYLLYVAKTGDPVYRWATVQYLFREKLTSVIKEFHDTTASIEDLPQCPNVDAFNYENLKSVLLERLDLFHAAPFTVQRLCELLTEPKKHYSRLDKFMRALEKNILVVSTIQPGRKQADSENGDYNGDISYGSEMEKEFNSMSPDKEDASSIPAATDAVAATAATVVNMEESSAADDVAETSTTTAEPPKETENGMDVASSDVAEENNHKMEDDDEDTKATATTTTDTTIGKLIDVEENSLEEPPPPPAPASIADETDHSKINVDEVDEAHIDVVDDKETVSETVAAASVKELEDKNEHDTELEEPCSKKPRLEEQEIVAEIVQKSTVESSTPVELPAEPEPPTEESVLPSSDAPVAAVPEIPVESSEKAAAAVDKHVKEEEEPLKKETTEEPIVTEPSIEEAIKEEPVLTAAPANVHIEEIPTPSSDTSSSDSGECAEPTVEFPVDEEKEEQQAEIITTDAATAATVLEPIIEVSDAIDATPVSEAAVAAIVEEPEMSEPPSVEVELKEIDVAAEKKIDDEPSPSTLPEVEMVETKESDENVMATEEIELSAAEAVKLTAVVPSLVAVDNAMDAAPIIPPNEEQMDVDETNSMDPMDL